MKKLLILLLIFLAGCASLPDFENCYKENKLEELCSLALSGNTNPELFQIDPKIQAENPDINEFFWLNCATFGEESTGLTVFKTDGFLCQVTEANAQEIFSSITKEEAIPYFELIYEAFDPITLEPRKHTIYNQTATEFLYEINPLCPSIFSYFNEPTVIEGREAYFDIVRISTIEKQSEFLVWNQDIRISTEGEVKLDKEKFVKNCPKV